MNADLVEQQTTTTGTGAYTVSGSVAGRRTFADAFVHGQMNIPYVVTDDAGGFECGTGTWDETAGTLSRAKVWASSNAGAAVNWPAGTRRIYVALHAALLGLNAVKHAINPLGGVPDAATAVSQGYSSGSVLINGTNVYLFLDNTNGFSVRLPVEFTNTNGSGGVTKQLKVNGYLTNDDLNWSGQFARGYTFGQGTIAVTGIDAYAQSAGGNLGASTTDATPTKLGGQAGDWATFGGISIGDTCSAVLRGTVVARDLATGDTKAWDVDAVLKVDGSGSVTVASGAAPAAGYTGDAGAAAWSIAVVGGSYDVTIEVTGEAAKNIGWSFDGTLNSIVTY